MSAKREALCDFLTKASIYELLDKFNNLIEKNYITLFTGRSMGNVPSLLNSFVVEGGYWIWIIPVLHPVHRALKVMS